MTKELRWIIDIDPDTYKKIMEQDDVDIPSLLEVEKIRSGYGKNDLSVANRISTLEYIIKSFKENE